MALPSENRRVEKASIYFGSRISDSHRLRLPRDPALARLIKVVPQDATAGSSRRRGAGVGGAFGLEVVE